MIEESIPCDQPYCDIYDMTPWDSQCSYEGTGQCGYEGAPVVGPKKDYIPSVETPSVEASSVKTSSKYKPSILGFIKYQCRGMLRYGNDMYHIVRGYGQRDEK